jgi:hypothetical protein
MAPSAGIGVSAGNRVGVQHLDERDVHDRALQRAIRSIDQPCECAR